MTRGPDASALRERFVEDLLGHPSPFHGMTEDQMWETATARLDAIITAARAEGAARMALGEIAVHVNDRAARADAEIALSVERLRALSEAATPGVWRRDEGFGGVWVVTSGPGDFAVHPSAKDQPYAVLGRGDYAHSYRDADFVVAAVNFVRAALAAGAPTDRDGSPLCGFPNGVGYLCEQPRGYRHHVHGEYCAEVHEPRWTCHPFTPTPTPPPDAEVAP